ncbi:MAG: cell wall hydrolase [Clostridia bacterium]|nr:cell wall hydrolase [Clostridia bacterium]
MTKKIRFLSIFACVMAIFMLFPTSASATQKQGYREIPIYIDGKRIEGSEALLIDSITYVPLRKLAESSKDCRITYNHATRTATVKFEDLTITVTTGKKYISVNGRYFWGVGEVKNINGSLYVPIRPLARALELDVKWNASNYSVNLTKATWTLVDAENYYDPQELYWLSRIIEAEAGGEIIEGKIAVGNVVLNRVKDSRYPNTIYGVIFDFKHGIQFTPAYTGTVYNKPSQESIIAAKIALEGYEIVPGVMFFFNPRIATSNWISKNRPFAARIGLHDFYY